MQRFGLALFLLLSVALHTAGAWVFVQNPEKAREERGAGTAALEIGSAFDSLEQFKVTATPVTPSKANAVAVETEPVRAVTPVKAAEAVVPAVTSLAQISPAQAQETKALELARNENLKSPDILQPQSVLPRAFKSLPARELSAAFTPITAQERKTAPPKPVEPSKSTSLEPVSEVSRLPMAKAETPTIPAAAKKIKATRKSASVASVASRKGGNSSNSKGTAKATGGNGGKSASNGDALTSNYMGKVRSRIARKKRYPTAARRRGVTGTAVISFVIAKSGSISGLRLVRSSGSEILNEAALAMAKRAAPFPPIPESTGKSSLTITLPINFSR